MPTINYQHELAYVLTEDGAATPFPGLWVTLRPPVDVGGLESITVQAHFDTGAELSIFSGSIAAGLNLPLFDGEPVRLSATTGASVDARFHSVDVEHYILGRFGLRIAFSLGEIRRNLLGRDFLNLIQIGFRERQSQIYVTPSP